jgi:uncharacterized metal-binding protein YceD (DUF177 family)
MIDDPVMSLRVISRALPPGGTHHVLEADARQRADLAARYGLVAVNSFTCELNAAPAARGTIAVQGRVEAEIVQSCIVTLAPVTQLIDEAISARYAPADSALPGEADAPAGGSAEETEVLAGDTLDLGAVAEEYFVLAIDLYPRVAGAELPAEARQSIPSDSPFAALAGLRNRAGKG